MMLAPLLCGRHTCMLNSRKHLGQSSKKVYEYGVYDCRGPKDLVEGLTEMMGLPFMLCSLFDPFRWATDGADIAVTTFACTSFSGRAHMR